MTGERTLPSSSSTMLPIIGLARSRSASTGERRFVRTVWIPFEEMKYERVGSRVRMYSSGESQMLSRTLKIGSVIAVSVVAVPLAVVL